MILTGKCKEAFEKWYNEEYLFGVHHLTEIGLDRFWIELTHSMQYGVLVDFFDSLEINICFYLNEPLYEELKTFYSIIWHKDGFINTGDYEIRNKAREKAIEAANLIYNERV